MFFKELQLNSLFKFKTGVDTTSHYKKTSNDSDFYNHGAARKVGVEGWGQLVPYDTEVELIQDFEATKRETFEEYGKLYARLAA